MRLAYLSNSYVPSVNANSVHVMQMCEALTSIGQDVILVHPGNSKYEYLVENVNDFYGIREQFLRIRIPELPVRGRIQVYGFCAALIAVLRRCELAYCRDIFSCYRALTLKVPAALELHMPPKPSSKSEHYLRKILANKYFTGLFVITEALREELVSKYELEKKCIIVVPDAAAEVHNVSPANLDLAGELQVGYVGSLLPGKGVELIPAIASRCPWAAFHVVGGSDVEVHRKRNKYGYLRNLKFHGFVPPNLTSRYLAAFDVVLAPNQEKVIVYGDTDIGRYTSPLKIFEYMQAGKPIVASDIEVLKEVLQQDQNAILCDPVDSSQWADALQRLRLSEDLRTRLGAAGRKDAQESWTWSKRAEKILAELNG